MKTDKKFDGIDVKKVVALYSAGWYSDKIADEMRITVALVEEILQSQKEKPVVGPDAVKEKNCRDEKLVVLTTEELRKIYENAATIGAKEGLKAFEQERKKEFSGRADRRIRNTKLLLRNYHMLREHAERSVFGRTQMEESALDILESMMSIYSDEVIIQSIKNSATRTAIIVSHIETMFGLYYSYCDRSANREVNMRRYGVVWDMYMANSILTAEEVAEKVHISKNMVYKDLKVATERLAALIFGVDGLNVR